MKKTYISPSTIVTMLNAQEHLLDASARTAGNVTDVTYGGRSGGGMTSDVKHDNYNVWNDDWSK